MTQIGNECFSDKTRRRFLNKPRTSTLPERWTRPPDLLRVPSCPFVVPMFLKRICLRGTL